MKLSIAVTSTMCPALFLAYRYNQQDGVLRALEDMHEDRKARYRENHEMLREVLQRMELDLHEKQTTQFQTLKPLLEKK